MGRTSNSKERLLQVAFDLLWRQSYGAVSVEDICERAKVKKGSFYHFFPSKCDLAMAAYEEYWRQCQPKYDHIFSPLHSPMDRIKSFCRMIYDGQRERQQKTGHVPGCPFASLGSELSTQDEKIRQKVREMFDRGCRYLESTLRDAHKEGMVGRIDFSQKSREIYCFVMGMLLQAKIRNDAEVLRELAPSVMQLIGSNGYMEK